LGSCYNFYTWAEQLEEFAEQVVKPLDGKVVLVANSIGSMSALQAAVDKPHVFDGVFIINPNFRELHVAETPALFHPVLRVIQAGLRTFGNPLFNALAKPETVKQILREPYKVADAVTDELVEVLLTPLLEPGSAEVVFDLLSYSSGPLPEQLLQEVQAKVEVVFGDKDPWTPPARVLALERFGAQRVTPIPDVGHCPHDEAPEIVNPMMVDFVNRVVSTRQHKS
jgi:pimeloyl-ACP methyl ester carboxylesterase